MTNARVFPAGLDRAGFLLSAGCAVHCAAMPFAAALLPLVGLGFVASDTTETLLLAGAAVIAILSMRGGCRHHGQWRPILLMTLGFGLILAGRILAPSESPTETAAIVTGAIAVASAHLVNWRLCCAHATVIDCDQPELRPSGQRCADPSVREEA